MLSKMGMKKYAFLLIFLSVAQVLAQPAGERHLQLQRFGQLMQENGLSMSCERQLKVKSGAEKTILQFFPFEHRLISTITIYKKRTSWSAQIEVVGFRLGKGESEKTHIKIGDIQKGGEQMGEMHLQMDLQEQFFSTMGQIRGQRPKFFAYEKGNLNHPFTCHLDGRSGR